MRRRPVTLIPAACAAVALAVIAAPAARGAAPSLLFAADTARGSVVGDAAGTRISLPGATRVTWFTDRPSRRAGHTTILGLARAWSLLGFRDDPPNAAVVTRVSGRDSTAVVTLRAPRVRRDRVLFRATAVPGAEVAGRVHAGALPVGSRMRMSLFIDDVSTDCGGFVGEWSGVGANFLTVSPACQFVRHTGDGDIDITPYIEWMQAGSVGFNQPVPSGPYGMRWGRSELRAFRPSEPMWIWANGAVTILSAG